MRFQRVYEAVHHQPWFISASGYASVRDLVERAMKGEIKLPESRNEGLDDYFSDFVRKRPALEIDPAGIAIISIFGVVAPHMSNIEKACGNTGYEEIYEEIETAIQRGAKGILFNVDSPGGSVLGCDEAAQAIASVKLPTVAFTDTSACSAAYYLAAGCDTIVATQSAYVGNIGTICPWVDKAKMWEVVGLAFDPITNSGADLKSTMHGPSITDSQRQFLQEQVNRSGQMFHDHVSTYRNVKDEVWRAGWYSGESARALGLIDQIGGIRSAYSILLSQTLK